MPEIEIFTRTYFAEGQVPDSPRRHMRIKQTLVLRYLNVQRHNKQRQNSSRHIPYMMSLSGGPRWE